MKRWAWGVLASGTFSVALAQPGAVPTPGGVAAQGSTSGADAPMTAQARARWRAGLQAGRKAHLAKHYAEAIQGFTAALAAFPNDPRALTERGWARFQAGDLEGAAADTLAALSRSVDPRLRGSALYNLGRVHEARGATAAAIEAWQRSLEVRPNDVVRSRLAKLAGKAPGPLDATPLLGPFADETAACAALRAATDNGVLRCVRGPVASPIDAATGGKAQLHLGALPMFEDDEDKKTGAEAMWVDADQAEVLGTVVRQLFVQTPEGTFVMPDIGSAYNPGAFGISEEFSVAAAEAFALPDGRPGWRIDLEHNRNDSDMGINEAESWVTESMLLCGIGPSGRPSCIGPINLRVEGQRELMGDDEPTEPGEAPMQHDVWTKKAVMKADLSGTGVLKLKVVQGKDMDAGLKALAGTHQLVFP